MARRRLGGGFTFAFAFVVFASAVVDAQSTASTAAPTAATPAPDAAAPITTNPPGTPAAPLRLPGFEPGRWTEGVHLLTGFGVNTAVFNSDTAHIVMGLGSNFKADVGWYLSDKFAVEIGSAVKFNRSDDYLIWDTLFTLGVRFRFHSVFFDNPGTFIRVFAGESPTVLYLGDTNNPLRATGASRAQINGPLAGFGGGYFFKTQSGINWFIEWDAAYQWLRFQDAIVDKNDVPIVLQSNEVGGNPKIFTLALNLGLVLF